MTRWYLRSGKRTSQKVVSIAKASYAAGKRNGQFADGLRCSVQPEIADSIDRMSLKNFASWSGSFTWRD